MVTLTVPQFLLTLLAVMSFTMWLTAKLILLACRTQASTLSVILCNAYRQAPMVVAEALWNLRVREGAPVRLDDVRE